MIFSQKNADKEMRIVYVKITCVHPNPNQPRRYFDEASLSELSESIKSNGILNPLSVRRTGSDYELIAGERRLRAARMAGLTHVPCIVVSADDEKSALLALIENLQRNDLNFFEEAIGYKKLIDTFGLTQDDAARRIGKTQSCVANKLRLLRLTSIEAEKIISSGLSERHARALLRIDNIDERKCALDAVIKNGYNVARTEEYIDDLLRAPREIKRDKAPFKLIRDVRMFLNTLNHAVDIMRQSGLPAEYERSDDDDGMTLKIFIPRNKESA